MTFSIILSFIRILHLTGLYILAVENMCYIEIYNAFSNISRPIMKINIHHSGHVINLLLTGQSFFSESEERILKMEQTERENGIS